MADNSNPADSVPAPNAEVNANANPPAPNQPANDLSAMTGMSLEQINTATGRDYKTLEDAMKGVSETFKFVGARNPQNTPAPKDTPPQNIIPEGVVSREEFEASNFLRDNPEHNKHRELLQTLAKAHGTTIQAVATGDPKTNPAAKLYQDTAAGLKLAEEAQNTRSALTSNPRLGVIRDQSTKAMEAFENSQKARASGDTVTAERLQRQAEGDALGAVISAFKMEGDTIVD